MHFQLFMGLWTVWHYTEQQYSYKLIKWYNRKRVNTYLFKRHPLNVVVFGPFNDKSALLYRQQALLKINDDPVHWCIYVSWGGDKGMVQQVDKNSWSVAYKCKWVFGTDIRRFCYHKWWIFAKWEICQHFVAFVMHCMASSWTVTDLQFFFFFFLLDLQLIIIKKSLSFWYWDWNIPDKPCQYYVCWCHGSLHHQVISLHKIVFSYTGHFIMVFDGYKIAFDKDSTSGIFEPTSEILILH